MTPPPNNSFQNAPQVCAPALQAITSPASAWRAPFRHEGPTGCLYLKLQGCRTRKAAQAPPPKKGSSMLKDGIAYLLKFAPKEAYIEDLLNGHLYMNAAGYYHGLPGEQGDSLEASMALPACIYGNYRLPIYCMYTIRENDIVNGSAQIPMRMIREFRCLDGWIGIVQYDSFARLLDSYTTDGGDVYAHGAISYGVPGPKLIGDIFQGTICNLFIKTPKYAYQQEYRIIGTQPVECRLIPDENHPGCKIEEYDHVELDLGSSLANFSWKASVPSLEEAQDGLILKLPHRV